MGFLINDDDDPEQAATGTGTTATTEAPSDAPACLPLGPSVRAALGIDAGAAVRAPAGVHVAGSGAVWYVSDPSGATWATDADPEGEGAAGRTVPLNDPARARSGSGVELPPVSGVDDASLEANASRGCATGG